MLRIWRAKLGVAKAFGKFLKQAVFFQRSVVLLQPDFSGTIFSPKQGEIHAHR
jgi:hypothetical protein